MENRKITQSVHADGSDGEKISAALIPQSLVNQTIEIDIPKGILNFLQKRNGRRFPYLTKHHYSVTDLVHCQRKSLYKQMGMPQEELSEDRSIEGMWSTVRGDFLHNMTYAYKWREIDIEYDVPLENDKHATVVGRLDMYDWKTKTIMDLKSTKNVQRQIEEGSLPRLEHILQVQCYGTIFADYIPIDNLNLVYVDNSNIVTYKVQQRDLTDWIKIRIQEIENSVKVKQILNGEQSGLCQFCRYQTRCYNDGNGIQHAPMSKPKRME